MTYQARYVHENSNNCTHNDIYLVLNDIIAIIYIHTFLTGYPVFQFVFPGIELRPIKLVAGELVVSLGNFLFRLPWFEHRDKQHSGKQEQLDGTPDSAYFQIGVIYIHVRGVPFGRMDIAVYRRPHDNPSYEKHD